MKTLKRTWFFWLVVFILPLVCLLIIGLCQHNIGTELINDRSEIYLDSEFLASILTSIATSMLAAGVVYLFIDKKLRELLAHDEVITVILRTDGGREKVCPPISRKDFCRAEVLGYIGMLGGPERFELNFIKTKEFGNRIHEIQQGKGTETFIIKCSDEEIEQFN